MTGPWQPLTTRGVAAFASARLGRLLAVQLVFALLAAGTVVWFLHRAWFPIIDGAISHLPEQGEMRSGKLDWRADSPVLLAEGHFLALAVDLEHKRGARSPAHVQVEFGRTDVRVESLFGFVRSAYPRGSVIGFNHAELRPWWGAWAPVLLGLAAGFVIVGLMGSWAVLATAYSWIVWLIAFYGNRELSWGGSWRLAGAALMPGALFMTGAIALYGLSVLDALQFTMAAAAHFLIGWVFVCVSPLCLPRHPAVEAVKINPFVTPPQAAEQESEKGKP